VDWAVGSEPGARGLAVEWELGTWVSRISAHDHLFRLFRKAAVHSLSNLDAISPEMNGARVRRRREDKRHRVLSLFLCSVAASLNGL
jgi:hypothetical protein